MHPKPRSLVHGSASAVLTAALLLASGRGLAATDAPDDKLFDMSIEELLTLEVTSVSRRAEPLAQASSAVFVITQDDIRRHGIRTIPEALRLAPGLSVLQIDGNKWAVGSRGSVGRFANKLLVLMDGRVLYTPSFSGVFWDVQDTLIEDIERIEVIRGPGATVWGANAVNGVINITTRSAGADPGGVVQAWADGGGSNQASLRYSGQTDSGTAFRGFAQNVDTAANRDLLGHDTNDDLHVGRVGGRIEWNIGSRDSVGLIVDGYSGDSHSRVQLSTLAPPYVAFSNDSQEVSGASLIARWQRQHDSGASTTAQAYAEYTDRQSVLYGETRRTISADLQHQRIAGRHNVVAGLTYRRNGYEFATSPTITISDRQPDDYLVSGFLQDEITLVPDQLRLVLGTKLEQNTLSDSGLDAMPTARILWQVTPTTNAWAAATRAVRTPSWADLSASVLDVAPVIPAGVGGNPFPVLLRTSTRGNPEFESEVLRAYEIGIRGSITPRVAYDLALFNMEYSGLRAAVPAGVFCSPSGQDLTQNPACLFGATNVLATFSFANAGSGRTRGGELTVDWALSDAWRIRASYSVAEEDFASAGPAQEYGSGTGPERLLSLRNEWSPRADLNLAVSIRHVDDIPALAIPSYWQGNLHLNWHPKPRWSLALGARNAFRTSGLEYRSELNEIVATEIERSVYVQSRWTF